jgi:type VI secretion system protein ImpJ
MPKVLWTKGVLLSPQHLQMQDRFLEELIAFRLSSLGFLPWGFRHLDVEREPLAGGSLALGGASGVFPDGMPFEIPRSDGAPLPKPLEEHWRADQETLTVYLAIPDHRADGQNISNSHNIRNTRFVSEVALRRDENTGLGEKPIQIARKNLRLLAEGESREGYSSLPVARIVRAPTGVFQPDPRFVPPLLDISASDYLLTLARRLVELLSARSSLLSGMRRHRNQSLAEFGVSDIASFWLLFTVNSHLPLFRHIFETRRGHPGDLYEAMLALAGALTTFSTTVRPQDLPVYDHTDLASCFTLLDEQIRQLLETVVPSNHVTLPLRITEAPVYATAIDQDRYIAAPQIFLAMSAQTKPDELARRVPQLLKVSSADQIDRLIKQALPGVELRHVPRPPSNLPIKLDYQYFLLDCSGAAWEAIRAARNLAAYVPSDFPQPRLELLVVLPGPGG